MARMTMLLLLLVMMVAMVRVMAVMTECSRSWCVEMMILLTGDGD